MRWWELKEIPGNTRNLSARCFRAATGPRYNWQTTHGGDCHRLENVIYCLQVNPVQPLTRPVACSFATLLRRDAGILAGLTSAARHAQRVVLLCCLALLATPQSAKAQPTTVIIGLTNSFWRCNDAGVDLGTAWRAASYPAESSWRTGVGLFGLESSLPYPYPVPVRTPLVLSASRNTYYFRTHFTFNGSTAGLNLRAKAYIDDGAVVYLNGVEVGRVRLPAGTIVFSTRASLASPEGQLSELTVPTSALVQGDNVLAVEVHQQSSTSSDIVFGLSLEVISSQLPAFVSSDEPADRAVEQDQPTTLAVQATGFPLPALQWFRNNTPIAGAAADSYVIPFMTEADAGSYYCVAANSAGSVTSRVAAVGYLPDTNGVRILYALGQDDPTKILLAFSEPPQPFAAGDYFDWTVTSADGTTALDLAGSGEQVFGSDTQWLFTTTTPRDPNTVYIMRRGTLLEELVNHGNPLPEGSEVVISSFKAPLILADDIQQWKYEQSGTDLGTAWRAAGYDDSGWNTGLAPFDGHREPDGPACRNYIPVLLDDPVRTCITLSNAASTGQIPTVYFRTRFNFEGDPARSLLRLNTYINDGAVFYLNGVEFLRAGMSDGVVSYDSLAIRSFGDAISETFTLQSPSLVSGENVLAVELHQSNLRSESMTLSLDLYGILPTKIVTRPRMIVRLNGARAEIIWSPAEGQLECSEDPSAGWGPVQEVYAQGRLETTASALSKFYRVVIP